MEITQKKRGVKPITGKAFTPAERQRRQRARLSFLSQAAKNSGYTPTTVLLNNQHILALDELVKSEGDLAGCADYISGFVFAALQDLLNANEGLSIPKQDNWPKDCSKLFEIQEIAKLNFLNWEGIQYGKQITTESNR